MASRDGARAARGGLVPKLPVRLGVPQPLLLYARVLAAIAALLALGVPVGIAILGGWLAGAYLAPAIVEGLRLGIEKGKADAARRGL